MAAITIFSKWTVRYINRQIGNHLTIGSAFKIVALGVNGALTVCLFD